MRAISISSLVLQTVCGALFLLCNQVALAEALKIKDDTGRQVTLKEAPRRIVSLAPHITEILFAAGAGDRIVGTVNYSDFPEAAKKITQVGGYNQVNFEKILALNPDLIIAWGAGNSSETLEMLMSLKLPVYLSEPKDLDSIANNIRQMGKLADTSAIAEQAATEFDNKRKQLQLENSQKAPISVFYEVWEDPLYTLGNTHFISDIYALCGATNIFADINEPSPIISIEAIVTRNPRVMLSGGHHGARSLLGWKKKWQAWPTIDAVKHNQMYLVDQDIYTRASPRTVNAAEDLCKILDTAREAYRKRP